MNSAVKLNKPQKPLWNNWLQPHTAPPPPKRAPEILLIGALAPPEWDAEKRAAYERIENSLIRDPRFRHISVLPENTLHYFHRVQHSIVPTKH